MGRHDETPSGSSDIKFQQGMHLSLLGAFCVFWAWNTPSVLQYIFESHTNAMHIPYSPYPRLDSMHGKCWTP